MKRTCPGCGSAMQQLSAGAVEVDRCNFCGGLWLDRGELRKLSGRPLKTRPPAKVSARRCAGCQGALSEVRVDEVKVDLCRTCGGLYLDDGELAALAKREVKLARSPAEGGAEPELTFRCPGCGERFEVRGGLATSNGLACPDCYGRVGDGPSPVAMDSAASSAMDPAYGDSERGIAGAVNAHRQGGAAGLLAHLGTSFLFGLAESSWDDDW